MQYPVCSTLLHIVSRMYQWGWGAKNLFRGEGGYTTFKTIVLPTPRSILLPLPSLYLSCSAKLILLNAYLGKAKIGRE